MRGWHGKARRFLKNLSVDLVPTNTNLLYCTKTVEKFDKKHKSRQINLNKSNFSYVLTELMQSDLHKIIVSPQQLTADHVKVFIYQILRGLKYLHSANILHRDIKPGNLLVNSNCILKICDYGLARIWDKNENANMTHEVVTQYYRAPELLMGARK